MSSHLRRIDPRDAPEVARTSTRNREFLAPWYPVRGVAFFTPEGQLSVISSLLAQRVLVKAGFEQYGIAPSYLEIAGRWQDHVLLQRIDDSPST